LCPVESLAHRPGDVQQTLPLVLDYLVAFHRFAGYQANFDPAGCLIDFQRVEAQDGAFRVLGVPKEFLGLLGYHDHALLSFAHLLRATT
jgi:hypothetical protein